MFTVSRTIDPSTILKGQWCCDWLAVAMIDRIPFQQALKHGSWAPLDYDMWKETSWKSHLSWRQLVCSGSHVQFHLLAELSSPWDPVVNFCLKLLNKQSTSSEDKKFYTQIPEMFWCTYSSQFMNKKASKSKEWMQTDSQVSMVLWGMKKSRGDALNDVNAIKIK